MQKLFRDFRVGYLTSAEANARLDFGAILQEPARPAQDYLNVVFTSFRSQADLFDFHFFLGFAGLSLSLGAFVLELAEVSEATNRGICLGSDLHQIDALFTR